MATIVKPPAAANASRYDKTMRTGNLSSSMIGRIMEMLSSYKGATRGGAARKPAYGTRQAATVARASK